MVSLAVPSILSGWLKTAFLVADTYFAGLISTEALGALSAGTFFVWMFFSFSAMNSIGVMSQISQAVGARDQEAVNAIVRKGLWSALIPGLLTSLLLMIVSKAGLGFLGLPSAVEQSVSDYLFCLALMGPFLWIFDTLDCVFRGTGDAKTPLQLLLFFVVLNVFLNAGFVLGWGPFPQLGVAGIALATGTSWLLGSLAMLYLCWRRGLLRKTPSPVPKSWSFWRIGLPITMSGVFFDLIWLILTPWIAKDGAAALAAVSIGHRLESYGYMTSVGLGIATAALVGQAVGLQKPDLAYKIAGKAARAAVGFNALWALVLLIWPAFFFGLFTDDVSVWDFGMAYVALAVVGTPFQALDTIYNDAFAGTGRTVVPMVIQVLAYSMRIPIAWLLMQYWGAPGVFAAIGFSAALSGLLMPMAFRRWGNRWENGQGVLSPTPQRSEWGCTEL
jgi:putative MATE family efflux protein